jgi:hypothetical protein
LESFFDGLSLADTHQTLIRNIISLRVSEDLFNDLSDNPEDWLVAQRYETGAKPHNHISKDLAGCEPPVIDRPFEEAAWFAAIGFPFKSWMASRYSDGSFGVWYGADTVETSVYETVHHWRSRLLRDAGFEQMVIAGDRESITGDRRIYGVRCDAALVDLRPRALGCQALIDPESYHFTQPIGARLKTEGHPGLITLSARCDGNVYAVLNPDVLSNPKILSYLTYRLTRQGVQVSNGPYTTQGANYIWMCVP